MVAHAAALHLNQPSLAVFAFPAAPDIPEVVTYEHFQGTGGLDGSVAPGGAVWQVLSGGWEYEGSSAVQVQNNSPNALAVLDVGASDNLHIEVLMDTLGMLPTSDGAGIAFFANGPQLRMQAVYDRRDNIVRLDKRASNGTTTNLVTVNVGDFSTATLAIKVVQPTIEVYFQGSLVISYNMTGAETTTYGSNTQHGMTTIQDKDTQFDYFFFELLD